MHEVGPCIPVGTQPQKAGVGPTSGPTCWRLSHLSRCLLSAVASSAGKTLRRTWDDNSVSGGRSCSRAKGPGTSAGAFHIGHIGHIWQFPYLERVEGVLAVGPPGPFGLAALRRTRNPCSRYSARSAAAASSANVAIVADTRRPRRRPSATRVSCYSGQNRGGIWCSDIPSSPYCIRRPANTTCTV
jgi:hypothetical protein